MNDRRRQFDEHHRRWSRVMWSALAVCGAGLIVMLIMFFVDTRQFMESWLIACTYWWSISLGALTMLGVHHLTGGAWAAALRTEWRCAVVSLAVVAVAFIPLLIAPHYVYDWATAEGHSALPGRRGDWLTHGWFAARTVLYFLCWGVFGLSLMRERDPAHTRWEYRHPMRAAIGLVVLFVTASLAAIDWLMSLDSHWYSTGFGLYIMTGCGLAGYALSVASIGFDPGGAAMLNEQPLQLRRDQGNFLLVLVIFWAYVSFMQYLIIWSGDLHEDVSWFALRTHGFWKWIGLGLIVIHFAIPFLLLLSDQIKETPRSLAWVAAALLALHLMEVLWIIAPSLSRPGEVSIEWLDFVAVAALGGAWLGVFGWRMRAGLRFDPRQAPEKEPAWEVGS